MGAKVLQAEDGALAVYMAREHEFDMIFMDVHMPRLSGLDAARQILATRSGRPLPIVALTADAAEKTRREIERAGIHRYLIKPISEEKLHSVVNDLLESVPGPVELHNMRAHQKPQKAWPVRDKAQALRIAGGSAGINFIDCLRMADEPFHVVGGDINLWHLELPDVDRAWVGSGAGAAAASAPAPPAPTVWAIVFSVRMAASERSTSSIFRR